MQTTVGKSIDEALNWLKAGELVAVPTETVYGLAGDASNEISVIKIFETKKRPSFNPLILHTYSIDGIGEFAYLDDISKQLAMTFMPGPFSLLLPKKATVSDLVTAGSKKVAVRIPRHELLLGLMQKAQMALVAPSANMFGYVSPTTAENVLHGMNGKIPYILDGGKCSVGVESTIVEVVSEFEVILHRTGGISAEDILKVLPKVSVRRNNGEHIQTSGQLKSHYATDTPLFIFDDVSIAAQKFEGQKLAYILFDRKLLNFDESIQFLLSPTGSVNEAAMNLFATMQKVDQLGFDKIITMQFPNEGIGTAINDRLERAQHIHK